MVEGEKKRLTDTERKYWKHFSHPGLPRVLDILEEGDTLCYVMEYFPGKTFQEIFREEGCQPEARLRGWMLQICDILEYLHTRSPAVIHGDLKPSNLYLKQDGQVILLDFGASFPERDRAGFYFGTAAFASPEQTAGRELPDCRSDLYSLGVTMYFLLTGTYPSKPGKCPGNRKFCRILKKCMREDRNRRYHSATELKRALVRQRGSGRRCCGFLLVLALSCVAAGQEAEEEGAEMPEERREFQTVLKEPDTERSETEPVSETFSISKYETRLQSGQRSEIKSAILSSPGREEGYRKLLELFLEDDRLDSGEELYLRSILEQTEGVFQKNQRGYYSFLYQTGLACRLCFAEEGGRDGLYWFEKIAAAEQTVGISESQKKQAELYARIGRLRLNDWKKLSDEEKAEEFRLFWGELSAAEEQGISGEKENAMLSLSLFSEMLTQMYLYASEFQKAGIKAEEYEQLAHRLTAAAASLQTEKNTDVEKRLLLTIQEKEQRLEETLQYVFDKEERRS